MTTYRRSKCSAWTSIVAFLRINDADLVHGSVDHAEAFVLAVTADHLQLDDIEVWIEAHTGCCEAPPNLTELSSS